MFFLYSLLVLTASSALIFAAPLRAKAWTTLALVGAGIAVLGTQAAVVLATGRTHTLWTAAPGPLFGGDSGSMDPLSALFVLIIGLGALASVLYSRGYLAHSLSEKSPAHVSLHYASLFTMSYAMLGVVTSDGGYSFLFFWELMTVASFLLILYDARRREVRRAALSYLIMMHIGFVLLLAGFVRLDAVTGSASFAALGEYFAVRPALPLFAVFLAGFGMKAGLFPMHVWLPEAHPAAPSHVSALMSGVMIKTGVYGILRVVCALDGAETIRTAGIVLLCAGIATGVWGVLLAAAQNDVKRLLAYSSIENVGIILLGVGLATLCKASGNDFAALCGLTGALLHTLNHSLFKSLLFFGAGNLVTQAHSTSLDALGGVARHMPVTAMLFLAGSAAICALPPLNGFVSELLIYLGLFDGIASGSDALSCGAGLAALALIGGVAVLAFTKLYGTAFLGSPRSHEVAEASEADACRLTAMALPWPASSSSDSFPARPSVSSPAPPKRSCPSSRPKTPPPCSRPLSKGSPARHGCSYSQRCSSPGSAAGRCAAAPSPTARPGAADSPRRTSACSTRANPSRKVSSRSPRRSRRTAAKGAPSTNAKSSRRRTTSTSATRTASAAFWQPGGSNCCG